MNEPDATAGAESGVPGGPPGTSSGTGFEARTGEFSAVPRGLESFACPNCGHELSMYIEPQGVSRAENVAARLADFFGSWLFMLVLAVAIVAWLAVNLVVGLLEPEPSLVFSQLDIALAIVAAMQGPLILLTQRRDAERDRARDIELFHIAVNTEEDVHAIRTAVEQRRRDIGTSAEPLQPEEAP